MQRVGGRGLLWGRRGFGYWRGWGLKEPEEQDSTCGNICTPRWLRSEQPTHECLLVSPTARVAGLRDSLWVVQGLALTTTVREFNHTFVSPEKMR